MNSVRIEILANTNTLRTCKTEAPHCKNCNPTSAESMPPIPMIANPGKAFATADTARRPTGLVAFPDTPPYVVNLSVPMAGHGSPLEFSPINPEIVLMAATPLALPEILQRCFSR